MYQRSQDERTGKWQLDLDVPTFTRRFQNTNIKYQNAPRERTRSTAPEEFRSDDFSNPTSIGSST